MRVVGHKSIGLGQMDELLRTVFQFFLDLASVFQRNVISGCSLFRELEPVDARAVEGLGRSRRRGRRGRLLENLTWLVYDRRWNNLRRPEQRGPHSLLAAGRSAGLVLEVGCFAFAVGSEIQLNIVRIFIVMSRGLREEASDRRRPLPRRVSDARSLLDFRSDSIGFEIEELGVVVVPVDGAAAVGRVSFDDLLRTDILGGGNFLRSEGGFRVVRLHI
mmetsp:Transcript_19434/g.29873  ORF Transcript_19434/g.29873 Transcript_19434/m.29873 type:complete len:218 (-) Transcript_19434:25-678(-)